jgi:BirA family transcriptional regulator, biotin operon repressor / biotin---[acetyl-CoA-carboxylase] ligase
MSNLRIPDILTDLSHVGTAGLLLGNAPAVLQELEVCLEWGYKVTKENDRGYLHFDHDQIVPYWIQRETPDLAWDGLRVNGFLRIDSTNREAIDQSRVGAPSGTLICAEEQTSGRGRVDRSWYSPAKSGLYFSLIVRPRQSRKYWPLLTHVASIALVRTILDLVDTRIIPNSLNADIKWPNDIMISGKKCAGILLEALPEEENPAVVIGVGINVHKGSVPDYLAEDAICIDEPSGTVVPRRKLLVGFLQHFQIVYITFENGNHREVLDCWKKYSTMWEGAKVWIEEGGQRRSAVTCGLDDMGALLVKTEEGDTETILTGNVRIRKSDDTPSM